MVRELFSTKREDRDWPHAAPITKKLAADGIVIKEVLLGRGAAAGVRARSGRFLAEGVGERAARDREAAKAHSDAMQYTFPLKEKQMQQSQLEAQARK
jgi:hypothetical protein